jgi:hypothetical protein
MSTRIRNDVLRLKKENEISTFMGRYHLNVPGPGLDVKFNTDPQVRLQKFGGNLMTDRVGLEDNLMCRVKHISRDYLENDDYRNIKVKSKKISCDVTDENHILESRSDLPAWTFRGIDQRYERFDELWINPQNNVERDFNHNIQTRLMEKRSITDKSSDLLSYW